MDASNFTRVNSRIEANETPVKIRPITCTYFGCKKDAKFYYKDTTLCDTCYIVVLTAGHQALYDENTVLKEQIAGLREEIQFLKDGQ